ncbi:hypothetical protein [Planobispora takensis]|uniref:Uncharacterized protein n=1 Tax=Planobispora takensis TaxID=1367882 RepID=A0A8J3WRQ5_9ACTN|nr:hypothetical protein [Planobispora takensis]GIH99440.1 hypothetical protein Pta02_14490 [Planobispora takensis]
MVGRILFLTFGCIALFFGAGLSFSDEPKEAQQALIITWVGVGLMIGGAACGAAERRNVPVQTPPQPPAPQHYPPQGQPHPQGYAAPLHTAPTQGYPPAQGYTAPYPHA